MELRLLTPQDVKPSWILIRDLIAEAIEFDCDGEDSLADIYHRLLAGDLYCHVLADERGVWLAVVSGISETPTARVGAMLFVGSRLPARTFLRFLPDLEAWAKAMGCDTLRANGRPAWKKLLPDYQQSYIVLSKRL